MIKIELLSETNFCLESLDSYNRKQNVNKVYRRIDGEYALIECKYTEDWDLSQKRSVAKQISGLASIPIKELAEKEPYDLQMICPVID